MRTQDVAKIIGVCTGTIRHWEKMGLLKPAPRNRCGWRNWEKSHIGECKKILARLHPAEVEK